MHFHRGTEIGKGGPILAAKSGPGGPILAADRFFRYRAKLLRYTVLLRAIAYVLYHKNDYYKLIGARVCMYVAIRSLLVYIIVNLAGITRHRCLFFSISF